MHTLPPPPFQRESASERAPRIYLSPPHMGGSEGERVAAAIASNWVAPVGPDLDGLESDFAARMGPGHWPLAVVSGTAALHLALRIIGVEAGDEVLCSTLTFIASATPALFQGAKPVFVDSESSSWNLDPDLLEQALEARRRRGRMPKAVIVTDLYGQCADYERIVPLCQQYNVPLVEDAAEAVGASCSGQWAGSFGQFGIFSLNGNKIITSSGGGILVARDQTAWQQARFFATQARDDAPHYEHSQWGYNYRLSNLLAAVGRGQLSVLEQRVEARRAVFDRYAQALGHLPGVALMPEAPWGRSNRWLTCLTVDPQLAPTTRDAILQQLNQRNIEARPVWKPLHLQPVFRDCESVGGTVSEGLFERGLCLPSGSNLTSQCQQRVIDGVLGLFERPC